MTTTKQQNQEQALEEFQKTRDILLLRYRLGHKHVRSTLTLLERKNLLSAAREEIPA